MKSEDSTKKDKPADEYTGNYGRGGYYGYTYDQEAYNKQVKKAAKGKKAGTEDESVTKNDTDAGGETGGN
jgi:hypothetical protein